MERFSWKRVAALFAKHYAENYPKYLAVYGITVAVPMLFGFITRSGEVTHGMLVSMLILDIFVGMHLTMNPLRDHRRAVIDNMLPVTAAERYAFILLNTTFGLVIWFVAASLLTISVIDAIYPPVLSFGRHMLQNESVWLSLLGTHAVALMINAVARRRLVMTYIAAFVLMLTVQFLMVRILGTWNDRGASPYDLITVKKWSNVLLTIVSWTGSYFILRRKQINW